MRYNIDPATGKRRYRKKPPPKTPAERRLETCADGIEFLKRCTQCGKSRDRDELFQYPFDDVCLLCTRKAERIKEGLAEQVLAKTTREKRIAGNKAAAARMKRQKASRMQALINWSANRKKELIASGVKEWSVYGVLLKEAPAVRERLGLPPSPNPQSSI